jgi:hypothetical protein
MSESVSGQGATNTLGKRYRCETCGVEVLCLKGGDGAFECHERPLTIIELAPLPASD